MVYVMLQEAKQWPERRLACCPMGTALQLGNKRSMLLIVVGLPRDPSSGYRKYLSCDVAALGCVAITAW